MKKVLALVFILICGLGMEACDKKKKVTTDGVVTNGNPQMQFDSDEAMFAYIKGNDSSYYMKNTSNYAIGETLVTDDFKIMVDGKKAHLEDTIVAIASGITQNIEMHLFENDSTSISYMCSNGIWECEVDPMGNSLVKAYGYADKLEYSELQYENGKYLFSSSLLQKIGMRKVEITINNERTKMNMFVEEERSGNLLYMNTEFLYFGQISVNIPDLQSLSFTNVKGFTTDEQVFNYVMNVDSSYCREETSSNATKIPFCTEYWDNKVVYKKATNKDEFISYKEYQGMSNNLIITSYTKLASGEWDVKEDSSMSEGEQLVFSDFEYKDGKYSLSAVKCLEYGCESYTFVVEDDFTKITFERKNIINEELVSVKLVATMLGAVDVSLPSIEK